MIKINIRKILMSGAVFGMVAAPIVGTVINNAEVNGISRACQNSAACREAVENFMKLKTPSRSTIKNLISRIVVYDQGNEKEVKVFFKFKELDYLASKLI